MTSFFAGNNVKYVVVVGGVCSSLGKGITCSSMGAILKSNGYRVTALKIDPYINTDAGLMSPFEHGEVFVLDDGGEVDLDLGNYERTMDLHLGRNNNITTGKVYSNVIDKERRGEYLGKTVQMVPHVTEEIVSWIERVAATPTDGSKDCPHICMIELGGTVGDIESMLFFEALRTLKYRVGSESFCLVQCALVPIMGGTQKTKPTQHTVKTLLSLGLQPDIIVCRCEEPVQDSTRRKISQQCGVSISSVLSIHNVDNLYCVPQMLEDGGFTNLLTALMRLDKIDKIVKQNSFSGVHTVSDWNKFAAIKSQSNVEVNIAIVAKYTEKDTDGKAYTGDTYLSVIKALDHSCMYMARKLNITWVDASDLEKEGQKHDEAIQKLKAADGILVPGGFGDRGVEGKIVAINFARTQRKPYLGICLGMQLAVVEFARNVLGIEGATSEEFDPDSKKPHVLRYMPEIDKAYMGANMVLGARKIRLDEGRMISQLYGGLTLLEERQRHRYEVNQLYIDKMESAGLKFVGRDITGERMEVIEITEPMEPHPFFLGLQCHPEFKSRPGFPAPPFLGLIMASMGPQVLEQGLKDLVANDPINHYRPSE